jgi:hypothetical protein
VPSAERTSFVQQEQACSVSATCVISWLRGSLSTANGFHAASSADQIYSLFSDIHVASVILYIISWADRSFSV